MLKVAGASENRHRTSHNWTAKLAFWGHCCLRCYHQSRAADTFIGGIVHEMWRKRAKTYIIGETNNDTDTIGDRQPLGLRVSVRPPPGGITGSLRVVAHRSFVCTHNRARCISGRYFCVRYYVWKLFSTQLSIYGRRTHVRRFDPITIPRRVCSSCTTQ